MNISQIRKAWEQGKTNGKSPAHRKFEDQMAKKTVINRALKLFVNTTDDNEVFIDSVNRTTENEYIKDNENIDAEYEEVIDETEQQTEKKDEENIGKIYSEDANSDNEETGGAPF